jgi:4-amino-4-deoxy-L-arabinose transferase-like glycosyltransferase
MLMGLSVRIFGLSSWSILLPEALCGVATVVVLFVIVRRQFGTIAATIAGLVMALTPAAVLIFRYNNPDALLTLLLVLAAGAFLRALETGRLRWVVAAAVLVGFAFNTKYLQAYLVLPAFIVTYAICAPGGLRKRAVGLLVAAVAVVISSGWWVLAIELIPAANRPYIGGSTNNSALQLLLGYDGLGRIFGGGGPADGGGPGGGGGAGGPGGGFGGPSGLLRMFNSEFGGQIAWLLPFSAIGLVTGLAVRWRARRTDLARAAYLMWGLWLAVHVLVFSLMSGIIHSYYVVAIAPAVAVLVGAGTVDLWALRRRWRLGGMPLAASVAASGVLAWFLLERTPAFFPGLGLIVLGGTLLAALVIALPTMRLGAIQLAAVTLGLAFLLAGPAAYAFDTMKTAYSGGDPAAGPQAQNGGPGGGALGGRRGRAPGGGGTLPAGDAPTPGGAPAPDGGSATRLGGGPDASADPALVAYLVANKGSADWIVATSSTQGAGAIQLLSQEPVMAMGGFMGSDPAPTLDQLKSLVSSGKLRYVLLAGGGPGGGRGGDSSSAISSWVTSAGTVVNYGGNGGTLYDLSAAAVQ